MLSIFICVIVPLILVIYYYYLKTKQNKASTGKKVYDKKLNDNFLLVVSFFKLTTAQLNRWIGIAKLITTHYRIVFVTESCNYINLLSPYKVICFTRNDFIREFPLYKNMSGGCYNQNAGFYMWSMWLESVLHSIKSIYSEYKYIWVMEGDVGYSGDISNFFKKYDQKYSDLLSLPAGIARSVNDWCWYDCCTYEYMKWIKSIAPIERIVAAINIIRLSPKLIDLVMNNLKLNRHSHCESTLHETARYNNLKISIINASDLGKEIGVGDRVNQFNWKLYNSNPLKQNKLYHALKF